MYFKSVYIPMLSSFCSSSRLVSTSAFAIAALSLLSCGGSGVGEQEGWAPNSPTGYFIRINTTTGTHTGTVPGVVQLNFSSDYQATVFAATVMSTPFNKQMLCTYLKTGKNDFTVSFDDHRSPTAPFSSFAAVEATCVLESYDSNTKYIRGRAKWSYQGWQANGEIPPENGSGTDASVEVGFFQSTAE